MALIIKIMVYWEVTPCNLVGTKLSYEPVAPF
jgi:hypothetical protein